VPIVWPVNHRAVSGLTIRSSRHRFAASAKPRKIVALPPPQIGAGLTQALGAAMQRVALAIFLGHLLSAAWLACAIATLLFTQFFWLHDFALSLPSLINDNLLTLRSDQGAQYQQLLLVAFVTWWAIFALLIWLAFKLAAPNNSFKPRSLRGRGVVR
jgi:hypothetical protein